MRWVGSHEICDCSYPTNALLVSAEFKLLPLLTKYYTSPAFYRAGFCQLPHIQWVSRHDPTGQYSRLLLPLGLSGHDTVMGAVCVNWSTESKKTHEIRHERQTHSHDSANKAQLMNMNMTTKKQPCDLWIMDGNCTVVWFWFFYFNHPFMVLKCFKSSQYF